MFLFAGDKINPEGSGIGKLGYLTYGRQIKVIIREIKPDIINVHYATSYGTAMALTSFVHMSYLYGI